MKTHTVEVFISVMQDEGKFAGVYILRALTADGALLHQAQAEIACPDAMTSDYARLLTLTAALERLHTKLCGGKAQYALRVVQSSKNVDGWLARGWKRNAEAVKMLAGAVDVLLMSFPRKEFAHVARAELEAQITITTKGVMTIA